MSIFKCKMCGGTIEFKPGATVGVCDSCGTKQTLPKLDDDRKANLYDRANHFRRNNDYDKAMGIYEQILNEDKTDAESYWSLVLCRYGIEYVKDPSTHRRVPTVNRAQFTSILADEDYKSALKYADAYQQEIYEAEAKAIDAIQKGILAISQKEEPFDVFICYKETDDYGRRTPDSVLANDLYHQLTQEGFKVFFSRITLEDKLGTAYEPYIFAALNSAKAMVVIGTRPEHFNTVWVKNEWSRYLALIKNGAKKVLIPAYRDMDPYDLPEEFSHLQAQDMSKLGFMQDLIRGITKIIGSDETKNRRNETVIVNGGSADIVPLLKRAYMFLEDGEWSKADEFCEQVLNRDPENAKAYLGKLMAELKVKKPNDLQYCQTSFENRSNYQKALRFSDDKLKKFLLASVKVIYDREKQAIYEQASEKLKKAEKVAEFIEAAKLFETIADYKDSDEKSQFCKEKAEAYRKDLIYTEANKQMESDIISQVEKALEGFQSIVGWKDADTKAALCQRKIEKLKWEKKAAAERKAEQRRIVAKKTKRILVIAGALLCLGVIAFFVVTKVIIPTIEKSALIEKYGEEAYQKFEKIKVGDLYTFGNYEQDNDIKNGKEPIEWIVLDKDNASLLLISKDALDCQPYNTSGRNATWETCSLRHWLNTTFLNNAFSAEEQRRILITEVSADKNPEYNTNPENSTNDKVFLLSITEVEKYFTSDSAKQCSATTYTEKQGAFIQYGNCWWWTRTFDNTCFKAISIYSSGSSFGNSAAYGEIAVRPAIWVSLE